MNYTHFPDRLAELRHLIVEGDLSLASRKMLDLLTDLEISPQLAQQMRNRALALRAAFNQMQPSNTTEDKHYQENKKRLLLELLALLDLLTENLSLSVQEQTETKITFEDAQTAFLKTQYVIYKADQPAPQPSQVVFEGKQISKTYKSVRFKLSPIDLTLKAGEITGVVGENGNGKTTLLNIVAGEVASDTGILSYPTFNAKPNDWYTIKQQIAFIPQHLERWQGLLKDNLHFSATNHGIVGAENEEAVDFIIHRLGLTRYKEATWGDISSGYKLRFALAKALVWRPKLLILDEPLANLDINAKLLFMQDLRLLANSMRYPIAILMSSQQLHEIESVVDNIIFLKDGQTIYNGTVQNFGTDRQTNTFELYGNFNRQQLGSWLKNVEGVNIEDTGQSFIVETPISMDSSELLAIVINNGKLEYFRDISQSTRKLFQR